MSNAEFKAITSHPVFTAALARAKGLARRDASPELSPQLLLGGFYLALQDVVLATHEDIVAVRVAIEESGLRQGLVGAAPVAPITGEQMPLNPRLQTIMRDSVESIEALIAALLVAAASETETESQLLNTIVRRASAHARKRGLPEVESSLFAVVTHHLYKEGQLIAAPGLASHVALNKEAMRILLAQVGEVANEEAEPIPLAKPLQQAIDSVNAPHARIVVALNVGLSLGAILLAKRHVAYHEAGHAVASYILCPAVPIIQLSIVDSDGDSGYMRFDPSAPSYSKNRVRGRYLNDFAVLLAGRAAERLAFGDNEIDAGAVSDLARATSMAWDLITCFGMDSEFGPVHVDSLIDRLEWKSGWLLEQAQRRLVAHLKAAEERALQILKTHWSTVERVADALVEKQLLDSNEVMSLLVDGGLRGIPEAKFVRSIAQHREVTFASEAGICETREGPVRHEASDAIVQGAHGEIWPIARARFMAAYEPTGSATMGEPGIYRKKPTDVLALQLTEFRHLVLSGGRGALEGQAGDWLVDYGNGDMAVVSADVFSQYYVQGGENGQ